MKKKKFSLTVSSDSEDTLKQFHSFIVEDADQQCLIYDANGDECFYPEIDWNTENRDDLDLVITCDFKHKVE